MSKFKIGDKVIMSKGTQYVEDTSNPRGIEGTIDSILKKHTSSGKIAYSVNWDNGEYNGAYLDTDIELVVPKVRKGVENSIDSLIMLDDVGKAHKQESNGWFNELLALFGNQSDQEEFFNDYEQVYKDKAKVKSMPTTYRTAKSVILKGHKLKVISYGGDMGKSAIEKAIKDSKKGSSVDTLPPTDEELLGTIIKACDKIYTSMALLDKSSKEYEEAQLEMMSLVGRVT